MKDNPFSTGAQKLLTFSRECEAWLRGEAFTPITLEIQPTERCNHHCPDCQAYLALTRESVRMRSRAGADLDLGLLDSIWEAPPQGIIISGNTGDPLLHPQITDLFCTLKRKKIPTVLITNGQVMTEGVAVAAIESCRGIRISLDAHDANSFRLTHGVSSSAWESVLHNVRMLMNIRTSLDITRVECAIGVGYLTNRKNRGNMFRATQLAREFEVDYIQFRPFHNEACDFYEAIEECEKLESPPHFKVFYSNQKYSRMGELERDYKRCYGALFYTVLDARGDFYICCHHVGNPLARMGSLSSATWKDFIRSRSRSQVIRSFNTDKCLPLCRLDMQNEALEQLSKTRSLPVIQLPYDLAQHAMFL